MILGLVALFVGFSALGLVSSACSPEALEDAKDHALLQQIDARVVQRQQLCASLPLLAGFVPAEVLEQALVACAHGDTAQAIAGALGGCYDPHTAAEEPRATGQATPPTPPEPPPSAIQSGEGG